MKRLVLLLLLAGCSSPSRVIIAEEPATGERTAWATVFLEGTRTRLVLSAPTEKVSTVRLTLWTPADAPQDCTPSMTVGDHEVKVVDAESRLVETPSGSDMTSAFVVPPVILRGAADKPTTVHFCEKRWAFDDEDRAVVSEFMETIAP